MILEFRFDTWDEYWGVQSFHDYDYELEDDALKEGLVKVLCKKCKNQMGILYNEEGAYQMANCIVYSVKDIEEFAKNYKDELEDEFINIAEEEFNKWIEEISE